jgi:hypothetical protein
LASPGDKDIPSKGESEATKVAKEDKWHGSSKEYWAQHVLYRLFLSVC